MQSSEKICNIQLNCMKFESQKLSEAKKGCLLSQHVDDLDPNANTKKLQNGEK